MKFDSIALIIICGIVFLFIAGPLGILLTIVFGLTVLSKSK
ncbi:MAG: hypothetical protein ACK5JH_10050 [Anaerocolumna sp.]